MKQYIVDAFTDKPFSGNPAAVCVMDEWPSEDAMMNLARENNLSETAFVVREEQGWHQGLGTLVVSEAENWSKELGFKTAVVESRDNKIPFYEKLGYVADYSQKILGETFTCYRMEKELL